jgi:DNA topoisomerase-1
MPTVIRTGPSERPVYTEIGGKKITDAKILDYIKTLRIPPAYTNVKIFISMRGSSPCAPPKLTYTGVDTAGRTQYGYSAAHVSRAAKNKFSDLVMFGTALPKVRARIVEILKNPADSRRPDMDTAIALALRIVLLCHFRLGNQKYKELYKSYGVSTLEVRHLKIVEPTATSRIKVPCAKFSFIGKKGVLNTCCIAEPDVVNHLINMSAGKAAKDPIFSTTDGSPIRAADINNWLRQFGLDLSSKQFRTFAGSTMLIHMLVSHAMRGKKVEHPESLTLSERKRNINAALDKTSETIHNTRAVAKKSYCHPEIIDLYLNHPRKFEAAFIKSDKDAEAAFMEYLSGKCRGGSEDPDPIEFWDG